MTLQIKLQFHFNLYVFTFYRITSLNNLFSKVVLKEEKSLYIHIDNR